MSSSRGERDAMSRPAGQLLPAQAREVLQFLQPAFFTIDLLQHFVQRGWRTCDACASFSPRPAHSVRALRLLHHQRIRPILAHPVLHGGFARIGPDAALVDDEAGNDHPFDVAEIRHPRKHAGDDLVDMAETGDGSPVRRMKTSLPASDCRRWRSG